MYLIMSMMITTITNHSFKLRQKRLIILIETCREGTQTHNQMIIEGRILKGRTHELLGGEIRLTLTRRGSLANSGEESMCFFKSKSRYSKTK